MRSIMEEKGILDGVVNEGLSKEMTFERPKKSKWDHVVSAGRAFLEEGETYAKALGAGVSFVCLGNSKNNSVAAVEWSEGEVGE